MNGILTFSRVILAAVFAIAGAAKLIDRSGSRQALIGFGLPAALATPLGVLLPVAELAVALALLPVRSVWWGALGALALLLLFVAAISVTLARGRAPSCHCFGQLHSTPVGWPTLARNGALAAIAGLIVWHGRQDPGVNLVGWLGAASVGLRIGVLLGFAVATLLVTQGWLLFHLLRQHGRLLLRLDALEARLATGGVAPVPTSPPDAPMDGLPVGTLAPAFTLTGLYSETQTLDALRAPGKPVLLVFSDPGCGPCNALLPELGLWQHDLAPTATLALISCGTPEANRAKSTEHGVTQVLLQRDREVAEAYRADGTPSAVLVLPDGSIGSPLALGADAIRLLVTRAGNLAAPFAAESARMPVANEGNRHGNLIPLPPPVPVGPTVGEVAPPLALRDLGGTTVKLAQFRGHATLVLFWNPGCGFCTQMLEDLKAWEAEVPKDAPQLLVVSTGTVEANRAMELRSPVVLDEGFIVGQAFGANGTPSAVLVDADGRIAAPLAVGASAVLTLAGVQTGYAMPRRA